jgi:hypothetical protein
MDTGIRSRLTTGFAVVSVGALVMTPVVRQPPVPVQTPAVTFMAATQPLTVAPSPTPPAPPPRPLTQAAAPALIQPLDPIAQQVGFHVTFVGDFLATGVELFGRQFAIPGALVQDIQAGTPVPDAVGRALQTFAQVEFDAGSELVAFAARYVSFQLNFLANLVAIPVNAIGALAASLGAGPAQTSTTASTTQSPLTPPRPETASSTRQAAPADQAAASAPDGVATTKLPGGRSTARADHPKKVRSVVAEGESTSGTSRKHRDGDAADLTSRLPNADAAAMTHGRSDGTHKRATDANSPSTTSGADSGGRHHPHRENGDRPKDSDHEGV